MAVPPDRPVTIPVLESIVAILVGAIAQVPPPTVSVAAAEAIEPWHNVVADIGDGAGFTVTVITARQPVAGDA